MKKIITNKKMHNVYFFFFRVFNYLTEKFRFLAIQSDPTPYPIGEGPSEEAQAWVRKYYGDD